MKSEYGAKYQKRGVCGIIRVISPLWSGFEPTPGAILFVQRIAKLLTFF